MKRPSLPVLAAVCGVLGAAAYLPLADVGFWCDDFGIRAYLARNGFVESVTRGFTHRYFEFVFEMWRPLTVLSAAVQNELFGGQAWAYRIVSYVFLAWGGASLFKLVAAGDRSRWAPAAGAALLFAASPTHVECMRWPIAGQQDLQAAALALAALVAAERRGASSFLLAAAAYLTKESAYPLPAAIGALVLLRRAGASRVRDLAFVAGHGTLACAAFAVRAFVLGGFKTPYAGGGNADAFLKTLRTAAEALPSAAMRILGPAALIVAGSGLCVLAVRRPRNTFVAAGAAVAAVLPSLLLPLGGINPNFGGRYLLSTTLVAAWTAGAAAATFAGPRRAVAAAVVVLAAIVGVAGVPSSVATAAGIGETGLAPAFVVARAASASAEASAERIAAVPGEALLVGGLDPYSGWIYPSSQQPPWRESLRTVYEVRPYTNFGEALMHLRPHGASFSIAQRTRKSAFLSEGPAFEPAPSGQEPRFVRRADGAFELKPAGRPMRQLSWLRLHGPSGTRAKVRAGWIHPDGEFSTVERDVELDPVRDAVVPLVDVVGAPTAKVTSLTVAGAADVRVGPPPPLAMKLIWPFDGAVLKPEDAFRPFEIANVPTNAQGLRLTVHSAGGSAIFYALGTAVSFAKVDADSRGSLIYTVDVSTALGGKDLFFGVEALEDLALPWSLLDRTEVVRIRLDFPRK